MMKIALWIIAISQIIRTIQNTIQLRLIKSDTGARDNAYAEFIKHLKETDEEFVEDLIAEWQRQYEVGE